MNKDAKPDELIELKQKYGFWLKPVAKLNISVQLPQLSTGRSISTTSVMEKINKRAKVQFKSLKITKTTIDFLRLEGELETMKQLDIVEQRLNRVKIKLDGFDEQVKLKANKVKIGPFKHDWETFFRDNPQMDELKPGYRPDTVVIQNLPLKWFSNNDTLRTNWLISVFSVFGDIRRFHIPLLDEIEKEKQALAGKKTNDQSSFKKFNFNSDNATFDLYLMYKDYVGFVSCMDGLRGVKLIKCLKDSANRTEYIEHEIKLDFDRSKHLSDKAIRRRQIAKKYGINTLEDLNEYKKRAKERKVLYEQRMIQWKKEKKSSKNLLNFLARLVKIEETKREEEEQRALNERLLKERLIEEEKKLRNKLIERQRSLQLEKQKVQGVLNDRESCDRPSSNPRAYDEHDHFNNSNRNPMHHYESNYSDYPNCPSNIHPPYRNFRVRTPDFIFKNPNLTQKNQHNHSSPFHHKQFAPKQPYQNNGPMNRNFPPHQHRSNYHENSHERTNYVDRSYDNRTSNKRPYNRPYISGIYENRPNNERPYNDGPYESRSNNARSYNDRSSKERFNDRPYDDRQVYDERYDRNYVDESNNAGRSYRDRFSDNRSYDNRSYGERSFGNRNNMDWNEQSYDKYHQRSNSSGDKMNRFEEFEEEEPKDEKSLKSFIVLPKR